MGVIVFRWLAAVNRAVVSQEATRLFGGLFNLVIGFIVFVERCAQAKHGVAIGRLAEAKLSRALKHSVPREAGN